jgi:hypothetical protein
MLQAKINQKGASMQEKIRTALEREYRIHHELETIQEIEFHNIYAMEMLFKAMEKKPVDGKEKEHVVQ